jgi:hypothetical protein
VHVPKVLSIGTLGNSKIDIEASASNKWCSGIYFQPLSGSSQLCSSDGIDINDMDFKAYDALLVWHQALPEPLLTIVKKAVRINPSLLIIGNSHGYNKSIPELYRFYKLKVPQLYMDFYSMWGPYFTQRYRDVFGIEARKRNILSLGSLRHDYLYRHFSWDQSKTNGKVLLIHEPVSSEGWNDPSPEPIGDNRVSDSILEALSKYKISFDFKVHPNWPDFISNTGRKMWRPPTDVNVVDIPIIDMLKYEAIIASWSSIQFEALSMGIPVINIQYTYPTVNDSEWGPGKYGLLKPIQPDQILQCLDRPRSGNNRVDNRLLNFFLGDLGKLSETYYQFMKSKLDLQSRLSRRLMRLTKTRARQAKTLSLKIKKLFRHQT